MPATHEEILGKVQATLVEALGVDEDEITPDASLRADLGAESIDFLDIVFRLEKKFGIKIERGELFSENFVSDPALAKDGKLTSHGLRELQSKMPGADLSDFASNPLVENIMDLYTVDTLVAFVANKVA